jgi:hypothetical protein
MRHDDKAGTALYIHRAPSTDHRAVKYGMTYTCKQIYAVPVPVFVLHMKTEG